MRTQRLVTVALLSVAAAAGACKTTVVNVLPVASVEVSGSNGTLFLGRTVQLTATPRDDSNSVLTYRKVSWSSSNPSVAPVSADGVVQALTTGSTTITASVEGVHGTLVLSVTNNATYGG